MSLSYLLTGGIAWFRRDFKRSIALRNTWCASEPLILKQELYATAAMCSAALYLAALFLHGSATLSAALAIAAGFGLRAAAIRYGLSLPRYRPREGRLY